MDVELVVARDRARDLCQAQNATREAQRKDRRHLLRELFGAGGESVWMQPPFFCDYGSNILLGERVFFNFNCVVLDVCPVRICDFTQIGPAVQIYTATHPMNAELRRKQEFARPIEVGRDVWLGGGDPLSRCSGRLPFGHRRRQRGHTGYPRGGACGRQPLPGHPRDFRVGSVPGPNSKASNLPGRNNGTESSELRNASVAGGVQCHRIPTARSWYSTNSRRAD